MHILVTWWCGYIGSHTVVQLLEAGHEVSIVDNLANSDRSVLQKITQVTGKSPVFFHADLRDAIALADIFGKKQVDAVLHFAWLKAVWESCTQPLAYFSCNIWGTIQLLESMKQAGVRQLLFSSSATVYDMQGTAPFAEDAATGNTTNPYGTTKFVIEQLLRDMAIHAQMQVVALRYFNPIGAHPSGLLGENPADTPNNLFPYICKVVSGELPELQVFGTDYPTPDGSGVRDYIHVVDLAAWHVAALKYMQQTDMSYEVVNLGTGKGTSVLELLRLVEVAIGRTVASRIVARRPGDVAISLADITKAKELLWREAELTIEEAIRDGLHFWQTHV